MADFPSFLEETLEAWRDVRMGTIDELRNIATHRYAFRPHPRARSVAELAQHILEVAMMMTGELTRPDTDFHRAPWDRLLRMHAKRVRSARTKRDVLNLMRSQITDAERRFRRVGELELYQWILRFDGRRGTKLQWLHHGIAHEMYHRGQLALYARIMGTEPALTKRIRAG
jgi:uncharacterized damage-inducible protein DinB